MAKQQCVSRIQSIVAQDRTFVLEAVRRCSPKAAERFGVAAVYR